MADINLLGSLSGGGASDGGGKKLNVNAITGAASAGLNIAQLFNNNVDMWDAGRHRGENIGKAVGQAANFIPGVGPMIAPIVSSITGMIGGAIGAKRDNQLKAARKDQQMRLQYGQYNEMAQSIDDRYGSVFAKNGGQII